MQRLLEVHWLAQIEGNLKKMTSRDPNPHEVTLLLEAAASGDAAASDQLLPLVYEHLQRLAHNRMKEEGPGNTLQATALVHEAYLRLLGGTNVKWTDRRHFFAAAALAMRRILVDRARSRGRLKRGGDRNRAELHDEPAVEQLPAIDMLALDDALKALERHDRRRHDVVMFRYFAGLTIEDTAQALAISPATVKTDWAVARVWLFKTMNGQALAEGDA
jgi:RNA polymerase sigma factor (TIGR02999 family)